MTSQIAALLLPSLLALGQAGTPAAAGPARTAAQGAEIERAVRDLGDDRFTVRERASRLLWQAGRVAEPALRKALESDDPEVVARVQRILQRFKYGIYPDTPPEVVALITQYRYGDLNQKRAALKELMDRGDVTEMLTLVATESDEAVQQNLTRSFLGDAQKMVPHLILAGRLDKADQLVELAATGSEGMRNYAAYLLLRGGLEDKIAQLNRQLDKKPDTSEARLLAYLLRAKGDLAGARTAAEQASNEELTLGLLLETGDWQPLAERQRIEAAKRSVQLSKPVESLGYLAAYERLAGNAAEFDKAVDAIRKVAAAKSDKLWYAAEGLLINGRSEDAVAVLRGDQHRAAFEILAAQLRFREALALEGVAGPATVKLPWMNGGGTAPKPPAGAPGVTDVAKQKEDRFEAGIRVASLLFRLGETQTAGRLLDELARAAAEDKGLPLRDVCKAEYEAGLKEQALRHAADAVSQGPVKDVLRSLFPNQADDAEVWWEAVRAINDWKDGQGDWETLVAVDKILAPPADDASGMLTDEFLHQVETAAGRLPDKHQIRWLSTLAQTCRAREMHRAALRYFELVAALAPSAETFVEVGDLLADEGRWSTAADWYGRAWERDKNRPLALYLQGHALAKAGQTAEGRKWMEVAVLAPLADANTRYYLAKGLQDRGLDEEAGRQWELMVRTGPFEDWAVNEAAKQLGNRLSGQDNLKASACWERLLLSCLKTSTGATHVEGYLKLGHLIHKARGRGLLAAGQVDRAVAELQRSREALPGEIRLTEDVVPELEKAGQKAAADALFEEVFAANAQVCKDFPKAATYLNNAAWMAALCNRRLDEALQYATRATELVPDNPAYLDTLAEVRFRRGDRQEAVGLARRCVELAPKEEHYKQQLARFEKP